MEKPESYFDWEQTFRKKKVRKIGRVPKDTTIINSIGLPHGFFKTYVKFWKPHNMEANKLS